MYTSPTPGTIIHHLPPSITVIITNDRSTQATPSHDSTHHSSLIITHQKKFSHHHQHSTPFIIDHQSSIIIIEPQTPSISMPSLWTPKSPQNPYFRPLPPGPQNPPISGVGGLPARAHSAPKVHPKCTLKHHHSIIIPSPSFIHHPSSFNHHHTSIIIIHSSSSYTHHHHSITSTSLP